MSVQVKGSGTIGGLDEGLVVSGIVTSSTQINVGSNIKIGSAGVVTATSFVGSGANLTGLTIPGGATNLDLLDSSGTGNGRIRLGASQDLQIYHDGSHSWFKNTTGRLLLQTDGDQIQLRGNTIVAFNGAASTEYLRIASDGDMGVGTNSPSARLHVNGGDGLLVERSAGTSIAGFKHSGASAMNIYFQNTGSTNHPYIGSSNQDLILGTNNSERLRIDSAGRFLKGLTGSGASRSSTSVRYPHFQLSSPWSSGLGSYKIECTDDYPIIFIDSNASYANGSGAGVITWSVKDGSGDYCNTASVRSLIDGTPSNDNAPGRLEFMTTTSGTSPTTKMTISSEGHITKPNQPSCMAYNAQGQHMSGGAIAQFNSTRFNIGGHYNSSNGRFTAPVAGRYLVAYSGLHDYQGQSTTGFAIQLNGSNFDGGEAYDQVYGSSNSHQCQLAKTLILNMSANDYVQIYIRSSGTQVHQRYGSFSVCLLT